MNNTPQSTLRLMTLILLAGITADLTLKKFKAYNR